MRKLLRFVSATVLTFALGAQFALAQTPTEASASGREENILPTETAVVVSVTKVETTAKVEKTAVSVVALPTEAQKAKLEKRIQKAQKMLNSRVGKWAVKRVAAKAERYGEKQLKKNPKLSPAEVSKIKEAKKLSGNLRIAVILGIIGILLTLVLEEKLAWIGVILIVIALVLVLIEVI